MSALLSTEQIEITASIQVNKEDEREQNQELQVTYANQLENFQYSYRSSLTCQMVDRSKCSLWSILKQCVDKELYRFTLPIIWNEPLSLLQRMAENVRFADDTLDKAASQASAADRLKYVAGFLVSSTSIHIHRLSKPFNPLLGETYEYVCNEKKFRICCEQVSHHPPISAYYSESIRPTVANDKPKWKYYGSVNPIMKLNILNACIEAYPEGIQTVELPELDEVYTWHNLKVSAHNLILGKLWFEYTGRTEIVNHKLNLKCILEFKPYSWFSRQFNRVEGFILNEKEEKIALLSGKWDEYLYATNKVENGNEFFKLTESLLERDNKPKSKLSSKLPSSSKLKEADIELIWKVDESNKIYQDYYNFSHFTFRLNELYDELTKPNSIVIKENDLTRMITLGPLPLTDSRYRPDMRLYENGLTELASNEKNRLEEKQRETQRKVEAAELTNREPLWFRKGPHCVVNNEATYIFNQKYWDRDLYEQCPEIF